MHRITLTLDGAITDTTAVELQDAEAFQLFMNLKKQLGGDAEPAKKRGRRTAKTTNDTATDDIPSERET